MCRSSKFLAEIRVLLLAFAVLLAGCVSKPLEPAKASRAEATEIRAKIYSVEVAAANGPVALRQAHDVILRGWSSDRPGVNKGQTVMLTEERFSISAGTQGISIEGQPLYEFQGFLEPVAGRPDRTTLNFYRSYVQNPGSSFAMRSAVERSGLSGQVIEGTEKFMAQLLPAIASAYGRTR